MRIAIFGYGGLGRAVEKAALKRSDVELYAVFSRRQEQYVHTVSDCKILPLSSAVNHKNEIDVAINCMGSARDLPQYTPFLAAHFNQVDTFDTHRKIRRHIERTNESASAAGRLSLVCSGWDPGLFSLMRLYMRAFIPGANAYTFWGEGVSRGHSNAVRRIDRVIDAIEYTVPLGSAVYSVRNGENPPLDDKKMHKRVCYVVTEPGADTEKIEREIKTMPEYFEGYATEVHFVDYESFLCEHSTDKHGGNVICCGSGSSMELALKLESNTAFTVDIMLAFATAVKRMSERGITGCITPLDVAPADLYTGDLLEVM